MHTGPIKLAQLIHTPLTASQFTHKQKVGVKRKEMEGSVATDLRLGLPGTGRDDAKISNKRSMDDSCGIGTQQSATKTQVVGWPPVRSYRKNILKKPESAMLVKVSMDGAPYLRKIDLKYYSNYFDLLKALETMFKCTIGGYKGSEYAPTYEDKDGDWMLAGDVPWDMFITSCKRLRIIKASGFASCTL